MSQARSFTVTRAKHRRAVNPFAPLALGALVLSSCAPQRMATTERVPREPQSEPQSTEALPTDAETSGEQSQSGARARTSLRKSDSDLLSTCALPEEIRKPDWPRTLTETRPGPPSPPVPGSRTIAVLPDTQYYVSCKNDHVSRQARYLAAEIETQNIEAVLGLGDLTEHNTVEEWQMIERDLQPLQDKVPLFLATGNHDHGTEGTADVRGTLFPQFLGDLGEPTKKALVTTMTPGDPENAYYRLPFGAVTLGVLVLEWSPRTETVKWAKRVITGYPKDRIIFVTHAYLFFDGTRYDYQKNGDDQPWNPRAYGTARLDPNKEIAEDNWHPEGAYDGEMLWNELLRDHPGVFLTLNGHVLGDGTGHLESRGAKGNVVHQVLANYQMLDEGGLGYLRLMEFDAKGETLTMKTYSPSLDKTATAPDQSFILRLLPPLR